MRTVAIILMALGLMSLYILLVVLIPNEDRNTIMIIMGLTSIFVWCIYISIEIFNYIIKK